MGRGWRGWLILPVVLTAVVLTSVAAYRLADYSWNQVVDYRSPYTKIGLPKRSPNVQPQTDRLILVVVDGLRLDTSREMASLEGLRGYGTDLALTVPQPSLSFPNWTTILSGAPQQVSGVTTNWYEGRVPVDTVLDSVFAAKLRSVVVGPPSLDELYGAKRATATYLRDWKQGDYLSGDLVTQAISLTKKHRAKFVLLHLPDIDEAGHESGGASEAYRDTAERVDRDLARLVQAFPDARTTFVVVSDHGHIDTGGHGGWEPEVVQVPGIVSGKGVRLGRGEARLEDVAPTVAALLGVAPPRKAVGGPITSAFIDAKAPGIRYAVANQRQALWDYKDALLEPFAASASDEADMIRIMPGIRIIEKRWSEALAGRASHERRQRLPLAALVAAGAFAVLLLIGVASRRALEAALVGTAVYYAVYNGLFFLLHGHRWSLSSFNSEKLLQAFFNGRMIEAAIAGLAATLVAGLVYPLFRAEPKGPRSGYGGGWATLGPATVLVIQATLALQVAWFLWYYGATVTWALPDFRWGFKYDLDLVQATALGAAAVLGMVATYLVGRYHPRVLRTERRRAQGE